MKETELSYPSYDGISQIRALLWEPDNGAAFASASADNFPSASASAPASPPATNPRCILQILHGMAEHIERYRAFASYCTAHGIVVCGHDHIGHGKSVARKEQWGHMPYNGQEILVEDAHRLRHLIQERYQQAPAPNGAQAAPPYVLFGHSMGSFVLRAYLSRHAEGLAAAILCGTGQQPAVLSALGKFLARLLGTFKGIEYHSPLLINLTVGGYHKQIANARTTLDWLSTDESVVAAYSAAENCGFPFGTGANYSLISLTHTAGKRKTITAAPVSLPLLFIAGTEDPVGEKGTAVKRAVQLFKDTGHQDVTLTLYEGMRHELLNEHGKERVYDDIKSWIEARL
jgi:alpha-beta hydrolase superfamily lysophospholipase